ncbi:MAG: hypothetical protein M3Y56_04670, partial [Armatimonadota bacterium]|nr:hypothetical protein [Armatimonadota bacterium]
MMVREENTTMLRVPKLLLLAGLSLFSGPRFSLAAIQLPAPAPECVRWASEDVTAALERAHVSPAAAQIIVNLDGPAELSPESFQLQRQGGAVVIRGGDAVGAMYGLQELAEQIRNGGAHDRWSGVLRSLKDTTQHPWVEFRADNPFCQVKPLILNDAPMWKAYIDMLARSRFNVLDLHGGYDLQTTNFPNLYPLLVHVPDYPQVGKEAEQARNLADFKTIIEYAADRGVKVAFMNYAADAPGVPKEKLADYTAKAVSILLRELPGLYMLGFRVGETGQKASFFQDAYLKGVNDSGR